MPICTPEQLYNASGTASLRPLVKEWATDEGAIFTLAKTNKDGYISLGKLFVQFTVDDPTEATFAEEVFGDISYWLRVREMSLLRLHLRDWREQADILRKKEAFKAVMTEVKTNGRSSFTAARFLIEEPWKHQGKKKEIKQTTEAAYSAPDIQEDLNRIMQ